MKEILVKISRYAGMREDLVQAGGGNTSVKISDDRMLIKASGYQLADITEEKGYAVVNYKVIKDFFDEKNLDDIAKDDEKKLLQKAFIEGEKPSIETFLHSITGKVTLHTHSVVVNMLAGRKKGMEELKALFPNALIVGYATPGIELAREYFRAYKNSDGNASVIFLKNHGLIVSGDTYEEVRDLTESTISRIAECLKINNGKYRNISAIYDALREAGVQDRLVCLVKDCNVYDAYKRNGNRAWNIAFCPDALVYCGKKILELQDDFSAENIREFVGNYGLPAVILYKGYFYTVAVSVKKAKEVESLLSFTAEVVLNNIDKEIELLSEEEQNFLLNWDAEKYRQNMK